MPEHRKYTAPFWSLLVITVIRIATFLYMVYTLSQHEYFRPYLRSYIPREIIILVIMIAEVAAYWFMRRSKYRKFLAWWHVGLWYAALILVPVILAFARLYSDQLSPLEQEQTLRFAQTGIDILYWACIILGHFFFAAVIAEGIKNRKTGKPLAAS